MYILNVVDSHFNCGFREGSVPFADCEDVARVDMGKVHGVRRLTQAGHTLRGKDNQSTQRKLTRQMSCLGLGIQR